jgi:hypothetical protein
MPALLLRLCLIAVQMRLETKTLRLCVCLQIRDKAMWDVCTEFSLHSVDSRAALQTYRHIIQLVNLPRNPRFLRTVVHSFVDSTAHSRRCWITKQSAASGCN